MSYYEVLGVRRDASTQEIERAYKQLARRFHPDLNVGDHEAEPVMKELNLIRATLTDSEARAAYDEKLRKDRVGQRAASAVAAPAAAPPPAAAPAVKVAGPGMSWMDTARPAPAAAPQADPRQVAEALAREGGARFGAALRLAGVVVGSGLVISFLLLLKYVVGLLR